MLYAPRPYKNESSDPKTNAQRNLSGRTHYVDEGTLRFHKSRVISAREESNGLLFALITSDALDMHNTRRGFRFVVFDIFGTVLERPKLEESLRTSAAAYCRLQEQLAAIDAKAITLAAIDKAAADIAADLQRLRGEVEKMAGR